MLDKEEIAACESRMRKIKKYKREARISWIALIVSILCLIPQIIMFVDTLQGLK